MINFLLLLISLLIVALTIFALGWNSASTRGRDQLRQANRQRHDLGQWVRDHWPDEYKAYQQGMKEGYQQGLDQAQELWDDL